jgi:hypothetical protein
MQKIINHFRGCDGCAIGVWFFVMVLVAVAFGGCGVNQQYTAMTTASANKDGFSYSSSKNQEQFKGMGDFDPATGKLHFEVSTTASTPEAAIAAALQSNLELQKQLGLILQTVIPLVEKAGLSAATGGAVPPIPATKTLPAIK